MQRWIIVAAAVLWTAGPAFAWGGKGHQVIGRIAERYLDGSARRAIAEITGGKVYLGREGTWPDKLRKCPQMGDFLRLHYVKVGEKDAGYDPAVHCKGGDCALAAITWYSKVLGEQTAPRAARLFALRWVVHLVGDIHQPLHMGHAEDSGGNDVQVTWQGKRLKLHVLWDSAILEQDPREPAEMAERLGDSIDTLRHKAWYGGAPVEWATQSLELARRVVYAAADKGIDMAYDRRAKQTISTQLARAGIRLAWLLNQTFAEDR